MRPRLIVLAVWAGLFSAQAEEPFHEAQLIFPLEGWHNHSSSIVEMPGGGFFAVWFNGSGERTADDVWIQSARLLPGASEWTERYVIADQPFFPDTNCTLFIDQRKRLWLIWPTIVANEWHTALLNYGISSDYQQIGGRPHWQKTGVLLLNHNLDRFSRKVRKVIAPLLEEAEGADAKKLELLIERGEDKYFSRMGWMTRTHPIQLPSGRILVPLYSDGYSFSVIAISDDDGETWKASEPLVGLGSIQPSLVRREDGILVAYMRDNGPAPKRVHTSTSADEGETWSPVVDTQIPNPGASVEAIALESGEWLMVYNDTEEGRHSLAVSISEDEGESWAWTRHLERDEPGEDAGRYHYPSVIQASDGNVDVTYSYFVKVPGEREKKSIKHARFNVDWVKAGD